MTALEKKNKIKDGRASSVKQKIDLLKTRDGSETPPIESLNENDEFNLTMLFGASMSENIDWNNPGIDGLMRIYYYLIQKLDGTTRDNNINDKGTNTLSSLQYAVDSIFNGTAYNSGFFIGTDSSSQDVKNRANRGEYDMVGSSLNSNIFTAGLDAENALDKMVEAIALIGQRSPLGVKTSPIVHDSILGKRFKDIKPENPVYDTGGMLDHTNYGDGVYDSAAQNSQRDYYDTALDTLLNDIKSIMDVLIEYTNYSKGVNEDYFTNPSVIPGRPDWTMQNDWINKYENIKVTIDTFLSNKSTATRTQLDTLLDDLLSDLNQWVGECQAIVNEINGFQGDTSDPATLRGYRFLWVKSIIDVQYGSRVSVGGIAIAIENIEKQIVSSEEGFGLFGIQKEPVSWAGNEAWIGGLVTPEIVGIVTYATPDANPDSETFGEMITTGYAVAWSGAGHSTGYDVYKSLDWDGTSGSWERIIPSGNTYTVEEIDLNNGKVLSYYIDQDVNIEYGEKPYYKVVAYDTGGTGDYARIPSLSEEGIPKNIDDYENVAAYTPFIGPSGPAPSQPGELPPYLYKWTTIQDGNEAADSPNNTTFTSEAEFDSIGSNLEVFVDGELRTQGNAANQYRLSGTDKIILNTGIANTDSVTMIVYFGGGSGNNEAWKSPVNTIADLPTVGNSNGDIRLVLENEFLYTWSSDYSSWSTIKSSTSYDMEHQQLKDMPDELGINPDHDARYYTQDQVDTMINRMESQLEALESLLPDEPILLGGEFKLSIQPKSGYISGGPFNFNTLQPGDLAVNVINTTTFTLTNAIDQQFAKADQGVLELYINGLLKDTFDLIGNFDPLLINGQQTYPPAYGPNNKLEITEVGIYNNYNIYQKGVFVIHITNNDLLQGENEIKLIHNIDSLNQYEASMVIYYDSSTDSIYFTSTLIDQSLLTSAKYLSGVRYYALNDKLRFRFYAYNLFKNTYVEDEQLYIQGSDFGCDNIYDNWRSSNVTNNVDGDYDDYVSYDVSLLINKLDIITSHETKLLLKGKDSFNTYTFNDFADKKVLVNTYVGKSDDLTEYFTDEEYRLPFDEYNTIPNPYKNRWNSTQLIPTGELQVYSGKLIYPKTNFATGFIPAQSANYQNKLGTRYYLRSFIDLGKPHNNGKIIINGYNISDENNKIYIKLPGKTGWLDMSKPYNEADFYGIDGNGCLVSQSGNEFYWTSGVYSTANSGYMIILRVEVKNATTSPIDYIKMDW